jgi:hypothetical protein
MRKIALLHLSAALLLGGCDLAGSIGPGLGDAPRNVDAAYQWTLEGWETSGTRPIGHPTVLVTWDIPSDWSGEPFRVYAKRSNESRYGLAATVTSCSSSSCAYADRNVAPGESYDYYVVLVDDRDGREGDASDAVRISVPAATAPQTPTALATRSLDHAVFLRWTAPPSGAERYVVYLQDGSNLLTVGETDGTSFFDSRAENGTVYQYRLAAVDASGHFSNLSGTVAGIPRPDYHAEVIFAAADSARLSGFRFRTSDASDPLVGANDSGAQWRLEAVGGVLSIVPRGQTAVTGPQESSALTCGAGSDSDCVSVDRAPAAGSFQTAPVAARASQTYVFRVVGDDNRTHYGKIRVIGTTTVNGRNAMIFDWAYQLRADEPSLSRVAR